MTYYDITTNSGKYRTAKQVRKTVMAELKSWDFTPGLSTTAHRARVADRYLNDDKWMKRRRGETAGSIARGVWRAHMADYDGPA